MHLARFVVALLVGSCFLAHADQPSRIHEHHISDEKTFTLSGNIHPLTKVAADSGAVDSSLTLPHIALHFRLTAAQQADLNQLLKNLQDRSSPQYHKFLTTEQYRERFGLSSSDMKKVIEWLEIKGFTDVQPSPMRTSVTMTGNASQAQAAFQVAVHRFQLHGEEHYANVNNPVLPRALEGIVGEVRGLSDFHPKPRLIHPHFTSSISGDHFITPYDFATIYDLQSLYNAGITGSGVSIAIPGQTDILLTDISAFRSAAGLPASAPTVVLDGTDPGRSSNDIGEASLDIELSGGVAKDATIIYVNSSDAFQSLDYAIQNNLAPVIGISYGDCEADLGQSTIETFESEFQQANALGITITAAGGDNGAADCDSGTEANPASIATQGLAVDYPASSAYVTGVGGSEFTDGGATGATQYWSGTNNSGGGSALSYIPETAWNDTSTEGILAAGGGGASIYIAKPSWQTGTGVPSDGARDVPDIALTGSPVVDPVLICDSGACVNGFRNTDETLDTTGGTSVGSPSFAGIVALINQKAGGRQGNVNPVLYELAAASSTVFHDITTGNNIVPCQSGTPNCGSSGTLGFSAGTGYDQVTGLGSPDGANLVNAWPDFSLSLSSTAVSLAAGASSNVTVTVSRTPYFTGNVSFTCATSSTSLTCTAPGPVTNSGTATLTIARAASSSTFVPPHFRWQWPAAMFLLLGATTLLFAGKRRQLMWGTAGCLVFALAGCGGGSSSPSTASTVTTTTTTTTTTTQTATVTLTATSGFLSQQSTVTVTLQ